MCNTKDYLIVFGNTVLAFSLILRCYAKSVDLFGILVCFIKIMESYKYHNLEIHIKHANYNHCSTC